MSKNRSDLLNQTSIRTWIDMHLNNIESGATRRINLILVALIVASVICSMMMTVKNLPVEYRVCLPCSLCY